MGYRDRKISLSILAAIFPSADPGHISLLARLIAWFSLFQLVLTRYQAALFKHLRTDIWRLDEDEYKESFRRSNGKKGGLKPIGDLGYSGSTFFTTSNSKFLIKSLPRRFEHSYFAETLLPIYAQHMEAHPSSLLVRITDFLHSSYTALGGLIGTAPTHHIVMENILYGKESDDKSEEWETYDLKPPDYFYPERDIPGVRDVVPNSVQDRLVDKFPDKLRLTREQRDELMDILAKDTKMLEEANAVDYSLFLVRYPSPSSSSGRNIPSLPSRSTHFRTGLTSADGKWVYRMVLLDFFWAKHKLQAKAMTGLVNAFNIIGGKGPMSITTSPKEYRGRFLGMVGGHIRMED